MKQLLVALLTLVSLCGPSLAETTDAQTQAILDALKSIEARLTALEQKQSNTSAARPSGSAMPSASSATGNRAGTGASRAAMAPPSGTAAKPGWLVGALPFVDNEPEPDAAFYFDAPSSMNLSLHKKYDDSDNWYRYLGEGVLNIYNDGRYGFYVSVTARESATCWGYMNIDNEDVVWVVSSKSGANIYSRKTVLFSGFKDIKKGSYRAKFRFSCTPKGDSARAYFPSDRDTSAWQSVKFDLMIKAPTDAVPRAFKDNELFHYVRQAGVPSLGSAQAGGGATGATLETLEVFGLELGDVRQLVSEVKVRRDPMLTAGIMGMVGAGNLVDISQLSDDREWIKVHFSYGNTQGAGYIKVSELVASSRSAN